MVAVSWGHTGRLMGTRVVSWGHRICVEIRTLQKKAGVSPPVPPGMEKVTGAKVTGEVTGATHLSLTCKRVG